MTRAVVRERWAAAALGAALFVFLVSELLPVGLMTEMARDLRVPVDRVGLLVSGYALVAGVVGLPVTAVCRRFPRRTVLVAALLLMATAQLASAFTSSIVVVGITRAVTACVHVVVWAVAPLAAADLAPPEASGRASGTVFLGSSAALLVGVPAFTAFGQRWGWAASSVALAGVSSVTALAVHRLLPASPPVHRRAGRTAVPWPGTVRIAATTLVIVTAGYTCYPYLSRFAARVGVVGTPWAVLLAVTGAAGIAAVTAAAARFDRAPGYTTTAVFAVTGATALGLVGAQPVVLVATVCFGAAVAALPVVLQGAVVHLVGSDGDTVSSVYVVAFQAGIALGAKIGADAGELAPTVTAVGAACALGVYATGAARGSRARPPR